MPLVTEGHSTAYVSSYTKSLCSLVIVSESLTDGVNIWVK